MAQGSDGLSRFRAKFFLAAALLGAAAGALAGLSRDEPRAALALGMAGPILLFLGGGAGGFAGMILVASRALVRGRRSDPDPASADAAMLLSVFGALAGLVLAVFAGQHESAHLWTAAGAFFGGLVGTLSGRTAAVLLHLTVMDEQSGEELARDRRDAGRGRDRDLQSLEEKDEKEEPKDRPAPPKGR